MPAPCGVPLGLCAFRITRLLETGCVAAGPNNSFVSTDLLTLQFNPVVEAGADITLVGGCDCVISSYRGIDKLKRFEFEMAYPKLAPAAYEMMLGGGVMFDGGFPVGTIWPTELSCGDAQPSVALEFWVKHWTSGGAQDTTYPWIKFVAAQTLWQIGQQQFQVDFAQPTLSGFSRSNDCWGQGPYGDGPADIGYTGDTDLGPGGFYYTAEDPPADTACDYADVTPSS